MVAYCLYRLVSLSRCNEYIDALTCAAGSWRYRVVHKKEHTSSIRIICASTYLVASMTSTWTTTMAITTFPCPSLPA